MFDWGWGLALLVIGSPREQCDLCANSWSKNSWRHIPLLICIKLDISQLFNTLCTFSGLLIIYYNECNLVLWCITLSYLRWCQYGACFSSLFIGNAWNWALDQPSASCLWKRGMIDWKKISLEISVACRLNLFKLTKGAEGSILFFFHLQIYLGWIQMLQISSTTSIYYLVTNIHKEICAHQGIFG